MDQITLPATSEPAKIELKELGPRHKQVISLLAQGVPRQTVAVMTEYTPEYVTWLTRQPVCQAYLKEINDFVDVRLLSLGEKAVDAITDALETGSHENKLRAAKLQMEATGRIGRFKSETPTSPSEERLERLSNRLVSLLMTHRQGAEPTTFDEEGNRVSE